MIRKTSVMEIIKAHMDGEDKNTKAVLSDVMESVNELEALSQEPTEKPMTVDEMEREYEKSKALFHKIVEYDDAISREAVLSLWGLRLSDKEIYMAIHDMESVTPKPTECQDAISREAVLKLKHHKPEYGDMIYAFDVEQLPPVTQKSGKWIDTNTQDEMIGKVFKCEQCGEDFIKDYNFNFCPNCGAKMESEE